MRVGVHLIAHLNFPKIDLPQETVQFLFVTPVSVQGESYDAYDCHDAPHDATRNFKCVGWKNVISSGVKSTNHKFLDPPQSEQPEN